MILSHSFFIRIIISPAPVFSPRSIPIHTPAKVGCGSLLSMVTKNEIMFDENQHRLLMCLRMAKSLGQGEVCLDLTTHKPHWRIEKNGVCHERFYSIGDMEEYLEHLLENLPNAPQGYCRMSSEVKLRASVVRRRKRFRTNGEPMTFPSRINVM